MPQNYAGSVYVPEIQTPGYYDEQEQLRQAKQLTLTAAAEQQRAKLKQAQDEAADQQFIQQAFSTYKHDDGSPDLVSIKNAAMQYRPAFGLKLAATIDDGLEKGAKAEIAKYEQSQKEFQAGIPILHSLLSKPEEASTYMPQLQRVSPELAKMVQARPDLIQSYIDQGMSGAQRDAEMARVTGEFRKNPEAAFYQAASLARNEDEYQEALAGLRANGSKEMVQRALTTFGPKWTPETQALGAQHAQTVQQRQTQANTVADDARQDAQNKASNAIAQGNLDVSRGNLSMRQKEFNKPPSEGGTGGAKLTGTAIEKVAAVDQARGMIDDLDRLFPNMAGAIGPIDQYRTKAALATGRGLSKDVTDFDTQLTALKNAVIKATTGAAMSEPEAQRIMGQIPDWGNPEQVFKSRLEMTRKNLELLKKRTIELSGGSVADAPQRLTKEIEGYPGTLAESTDGGKTWKRIQ